MIYIFWSILYTAEESKNQAKTEVNVQHMKMFGWLGSRTDTVYPLDAPDLGTENVRPTVASVTEKDKLWSGLLAAFANNVSVVGIKYFVDANAYVLRRLLWLCLVLLGVGLLFYQV